MAVDTVVGTWSSGSVAALSTRVTILSSTAVPVWGTGGVQALNSSPNKNRTAYVTTTPYGSINTAQRPTVGLLYPRYSRPFTPA